MKNLRSLLHVVLALTLSLSFYSCHLEEDEEQAKNEAIATASQYNAIVEKALSNQKQSFTIDASSGTSTITTAKGVKLYIYGASLRKEGAPVSGNVDVEIIELFDKGSMVVCNKPTMGVQADGSKALLISGGEFYIRLSQAGVDLTTERNVTLVVPATSTTAQMKIWNGTINASGNLAWTLADTTSTPGAVDSTQIRYTDNAYYCNFRNFGWINCDYFNSDIREKTNFKAFVPPGYNNTNCKVYVSFAGLGKAQIGQFGFDENPYFTYYKIPVGLACHIIFVSAQGDGNWKWCIKDVTISSEGSCSFGSNETSSGNENSLVAAINALP